MQEGVTMLPDSISGNLPVLSVGFSAVSAVAGKRIRQDWECLKDERAWFANGRKLDRMHVCTGLFSWEPPILRFPV